jgi:hypothetical protein
MKPKNDFKFDPENGGGRRRRVKNVSRIDMLLNEEMEDCENEPELVIV